MTPELRLNWICEGNSIVAPQRIIGALSQDRLSLLAQVIDGIWLG